MNYCDLALYVCYLSLCTDPAQVPLLYSQFIKTSNPLVLSIPIKKKHTFPFIQVTIFSTIDWLTMYFLNKIRFFINTLSNVLYSLLLLSVFTQVTFSFVYNLMKIY